MAQSKSSPLIVLRFSLEHLSLALQADSVREQAKRSISIAGSVGQVRTRW